ncbi:MAG: hypothetical protein IJW52_00665 [Clostridia bacterium]|nr:hypothetical protein [Clostridia bacterium]
MKNTMLNRAICFLLCLSMMLGTLIFTSCNTDTTDAKDDEYSVDYVLALRVIDDIKIGGRFTNDKVEVVQVRPDAVPEGIYSDISDLKDKYAASQLCVGDFVTAAKVTDTKPEDAVDENEDIEIGVEIDPYELGYVVITKYKSESAHGDFAPAIQKAIDENPGRTIYFPDGIYQIKSPIYISTDPAKSVSLRLSHLAVISAAQDWSDKTSAMIQIGCKQESEHAPAADDAVASMNGIDLSSERSISIIGGCIDGNSKASGIAIGGGKDTYIYNVSIKSIYNGIHVLKGPNELGATWVNVDNVNITGYEAEESSGLLIEGTYNTFSNMRIASVNYGLLCTETGERNIFRNLHPLVVGMNNRYTVGFWDKSDGNNFDICYSDQFSAGYRVEENTRSVMNGGFCYWWTERNNYHVGYESAGKFNSIIVSGYVSHGHAVEIDAYLFLGEDGGQGVVLYPVINIPSGKYQYMLEKHCKTPIIN